jgi:hypothetical protein
MKRTLGARVACLLFAGGLAACSGGGTGGSAAAPAMMPSNVSNSTATLSLTIPSPTTSAARRSPSFVSPNSSKIVVTVKTVNGQPPTATQVPVANPTTTALSTGPGGNCAIAVSGETCIVSIPAPSGAVVYQFDLLDASANILATNTVTFQIQPGANTFSAQLMGVVATVSVFAPTLHKGTSFSGPITVNAFDASGALIVGAALYAYTFKLTDNDATGHTSLTNNAVTGATVTVGSPNDVVILNYDGGTDSTFTITATNGNGPKAISGGGTVTAGP